MRTGLIVKKIGSSRVFNEKKEVIPVTVLHLDCVVVDHKTEEKHGYNAIRIGYGKQKESRVGKPMREFYKKNNLDACKKIAEFRIDEKSFIPQGHIFKVDHFIKDQYVDVTGTSLGKGFAGVIKRHNFSMAPATHGVSLAHRSHGSTGHCQDPGRVFKGKKMAGHMGNAKTTVQNLQVVDVDKDNNLIIVKGHVPGSKGSLLFIKDSVKKINSNLPHPTAE